MKKWFLFLLSTGLLVQSYAQNTPASRELTKGKALGINLILTDFQTAADIRNLGLVKVLDQGNFFITQRMAPGLSVNYLSGLSKHVDFISSLGATFVDYPVKDEPSVGQKLLMDVTAQLNMKLLTDNYIFNPYIDLGVGASTYNKGFAAFIPAGLGMQIRMGNEAFLMLNSQYRIPVTEKASYHFQHSLGVVGIIAPRKAEAVAEIPVPAVADRDGDGVPDSEDRCPDLAGPAALKGCPDRDGDGIPDIDDKCPDVKGVAKYDGCPVPDTDGDGINDEEDKCPNVPGVARYNGCPIPDSDGDGVNDEEDKCPTVPGPATNHGCPVIEQVVVEKVNKAAQNIFFATGSAKLLDKSFASLKEVVEVMKENPSFKIEISGHTDNTGGEELNQKLSESRAESVKQYLLSHGIDADRITAAGYGLSKPIADNKTAAGRAKNRRVEMRLSNY